MRVAYNADRSIRYYFPHEHVSPAERSGATMLDDTTSRGLTVYCPDPHCDFPLIHHRGNGTRAPHWAHPPRTAEFCGEGGGPEGAWHRFVTRDLFGAALAHEVCVPGARADLIVERRKNGRRTAFEIQHSPIKLETIYARSRAHEQHGFVATIWIVDGAVAALGVDTDDWADDTTMPSVTVTTQWVIDLLEESIATHPGYRMPVAFLVETPAGHVLRFVDVADIRHTAQGTRTATVKKWTAPVPEHVLRDWAAGPARTLGQEDHPAVTLMDTAPTRKVKAPEHDFSAKVNAARTLVRVMFSRHHTAVRTQGETLGLTWESGGRAYSDGSHAGAGRLLGPWTTQVQTWLDERDIPMVYATAEAA